MQSLEVYLQINETQQKPQRLFAMLTKTIFGRWGALFSPLTLVGIVIMKERSTFSWLYHCMTSSMGDGPLIAGFQGRGLPPPNPWSDAGPLKDRHWLCGPLLYRLCCVNTAVEWGPRPHQDLPDCPPFSYGRLIFFMYFKQSNIAQHSDYRNRSIKLSSIMQTLISW